MNTSSFKLSNKVTLLIGFLMGLLLWGTAHWVNTDAGHQQAEEPLYWVAPMDANYRRDAPGKSPMGMDLVPVYATLQNDKKADNDVSGVVTISPHVINNMGVKIDEVVTGSLALSVKTVGFIQYDEEQRVHIHPRVDGWVEALYVAASGEPVSKGQPLYTLYSPQLVTAQEEFVLSVKRNNQALVKATKARLRALQVPESIIKELQQSLVVKPTITFYAPQSGVVDNLNISEGFYVSPGDTLMSIGDLSSVWLEAQVSEKDISVIHSGLSTAITLDAYPGRQWQGVIDYVYPSLNTVTHALRVRVKLANQDLLLKPHMHANVDIQLHSSQPLPLIPSSALIQTGEQDRVVLALGEGKFKSVAVVIGRRNHHQVEILSGLAANDKIVTSAQFLIDSESSIDSDFQRMLAPQQASVWVKGVVESAINNKRILTITHEPVPEWQWPVMTMNFILSEALDQQSLTIGTSASFRITEVSSGYQIIDYTVIEQAMDMHQHHHTDVPQATVKGTVKQIDLSLRVLTIDREGIPKWDRGPATMDFLVVDELDIESVMVGDAIEFTFEVHDDLVVTALTILPQMSPLDDTDKGEDEDESEHMHHHH